MNVNILTPINIEDYSLKNSIDQFYSLTETINKSPDKQVNIDLSECRFAYPLFLANLLILRDDNTREVTFKNMTSYLETISFPKTVNYDESTESRFASKTYLPVISLAMNSDQKDNGKSSIARAISNLLSSKDVFPAQVRQSITYVLQEIIDNVTEHARAQNMYALAQIYPKKHFVEIVIADNGCSLKGSYQAAGLPAKNDLDAMANVAASISSKDRPDNESRGFGLFTSRKIAVNGLSGEFACMSGNAVYYKNASEETISILDGLNVKGTITALRMHYNNEKFNFYNYLEF